MDKNMQILIVDDFSTMRRIIRNLLHELGFENTTEANDGNTAVPVLESKHVDLVLLDWNMPTMPGIDLLRWIRGNERLAKLPVLMITAEAKREQIVEAAEAGVNGYIVKPFNAVTLKSKLERIFERMEA